VQKYTLGAIWKENGKMVHAIRVLPVRGGDCTVVDRSRPDDPDPNVLTFTRTPGGACLHSGK
jgi:hypothetical protein